MYSFSVDGVCVFMLASHVDDILYAYFDKYKYIIDKIKSLLALGTEEYFEFRLKNFDKIRRHLKFKLPANLQL